MSASLEQLLHAHIAAAAAWRHWMDVRDDYPEDDPADLAARWRMPWIEAEERLAALLGPLL